MLSEIRMARIVEAIGRVRSKSLSCIEAGPKGRRRAWAPPGRQAVAPLLTVGETIGQRAIRIVSDQKKHALHRTVALIGKSHGECNRRPAFQSCQKLRGEISRCRWAIYTPRMTACGRGPALAA